MHNTHSYMFQSHGTIFRESKVQRFASANTAILVLQQLDIKKLQLKNYEVVDFRNDIRQKCR